MKLTKLLILFLFLSLKGFSQQAVLTSSGDKVILNFLSSLGGTITGTLGITGNTTISGTTTLTGINNTGTITNTGALTNTGNLTVNGNGTITGTLNVGSNNTISGTQSFAAGLSNRAAGAQSIAMGYSTTANGDRSTAMGRLTTASGNISAAMGYGTSAYSFGETVIGMNNTSYTPSSTSTFSAVDRLFVVGNGVSSGSKSDASTTLKDGTLTVNGATTINNNATITGTLTLPSLTASTLIGTDGSKGVATGNLTGDITTSGFTATLSNTGVISGTYGSSTAVPQITVDSKGRITTITTTTITHYIGESYGGGIVFYVYENGKHGLIAATSDQSTGIRWNGGSDIITRARADGVGAGLKNTAIIIGAQVSTNSPTYDGNAFAATVCNEYSVTATTGGITTTYGDWYLPSKHELDLLYLQKTVVDGFEPNFYWSSTEQNSDFALYKNFDDGSYYYLSKVYTLRVRAIRSF